MEGSTWFSLILLCFVWLPWVYIDPTVGYSLKNCTIRRSLNNTVLFFTPTVLCFKMNFHAVPFPIPPNAVTLDISFNYISQIKVGDFKNLTNLKNLNVSNNQISHMEAGAFRELTALCKLNLAHNNLRTISNNNFQGLVNLKTLRLDNNHISSIESSAFCSLFNLETVNLTGNKFQHIESVHPILKLPALQELYIGSNRISTFRSQEVCNTSLVLKLLDLSWNPLEIFQITEDILPRLETLDISYCGGNGHMQWDVGDRSFLRNVNRLNVSGLHISEQDAAKIFRSFSLSLQNLRLYDMKHLRIESLLKDACQIPSLRVVRLKNNNLTSVNDQLFRPCSLVNELDLSSNCIHDVSQFTFRPFVQLATLRLAYNKLRLVPRAVQNLTTLGSLDLTYNSISKLSCSDFANLTQVTRLQLFRNHISALSGCFFRDLQNLQTLKLGSNKILSVMDAFKTGLQKLQHLELRSNKLSAVKGGDFQSLRSLQYLDLVDNQISRIEDEAFIGLDNLTELYLGSNKITQVTISAKNIFSGLCNLKVLQLSSNYISYESSDKLDHPPFRLLKTLMSLSINSQGHKGLRNVPSNLLYGLSSLQTIEIGNGNIEFLHQDTFNHTPHLSYLDISKNVFTALTPQVWQKIPDLTVLVLSKARLQSLDFLINANLSKVQSLQVRRNELAVINETLIRSLPALTYLNLEENAFTCDCNNAWFINWAETDNRTQVVSASMFACNYPPDLRGTKLVDLDTDSCTVDIGMYCFICTATVVLLTLLASFFYHFLRWQVIYAYYLFLAFLYDYRQKKMHKRPHFQYDAFVSYNFHDEPWVLEKLLPELEGEQGWKLCLHQRDFQPGRPILDNIVDGIYGSRKTICVITRHYLESDWCSREIQVASFRLFDERKDVLILVFLEDIPASQLSPYHRMRKLVKKRTYLCWPKPGEDTRVFWHKLKMALETRAGPDEENAILSGLEH
ncbi:toll-like receptor 13 [Megalops cyprinoides]|uniref:toll-like receptor 13 n=1 Tax=Megalops cyprinoides TaxID=118141 RepID=UPI001864558B|nr:toll-like receptor 13 [Megalops cyprinoides]